MLWHYPFAALLVTAIVAPAAAFVLGREVRTVNGAAFPPIPIQQLVFGSCTFPPPLPLGPGQLMECTTLPVPLDWNNASGRAITLHVTRIRSSATVPGTPQLWMLQGGPGASDETIIPAGLQVQSVAGFDVYLPDHRGTGLSTRLACDAQGSQKVNAACVAYLNQTWGSGLHNFSITSASHDLAYLLLSAQPGAGNNATPARIYAVSYGTHLLDRLLQAHAADLPFLDGAVMDGVVNPALTSVSRYDLTANAAAMDTLAYCVTDPFCSPMFAGTGGSAAAALRSILDAIDAGTQPCISTYFPLLSSTALKNGLFQSIESGQTYYQRNLIPAVIFRILRCNSNDTEVLGRVFGLPLTASGIATTSTSHSGKASAEKWSSFTGAIRKTASSGPNDDPTVFSSALNYNIVLSERWLAPGESNPNLSDVNSWFRSTIVAPADAAGYATMFPLWDRYPLDNYYGRVNNFSRILMMQGTLDPATPYPQFLQLAAMRPNRLAVSVPLAGHVTSLLAAVDPALNCPLEIILQYLSDPSTAPDTGCIADMPTSIDFAGVTKGTQLAALQVMGTPDAWGCPAVGIPCPLPGPTSPPVWPAPDNTPCGA